MSFILYRSSNIFLVAYYLISLFIYAFSLNVYADAEALVIVDNEISSYQIVYDRSAVKSVSQAALELQRLIKKSTGVELKVTTKLCKVCNKIIIGKHSLIPDEFPKINTIKPDAYYIKTKGGDIFIVGADDEVEDLFYLDLNKSASVGTYFAVIDFSRRFLGVEWYMPGPFGEEIHMLTKLAIPKTIDIAVEPHFSVRYIDIMQFKSLNQQQRLMARGRLKEMYFNPSIVKQANVWGRRLRLGSNIQLNVGHGWYQWIPDLKSSTKAPKSYADTHPGFFAEPKNYNKRRNASKANVNGQLCICNPEVAEEYAKNIVRFSRLTGEKSFSLSANDGGWSCHCDCCKKREELFNTKGAELTSELIKFANNVAGLVIEHIPDAEFGLYAYDWAQIPPIKGTKAREEIHISDVYNGLAYKYWDKKSWKFIDENLTEWREAASDITLTTYYSYYGHYSFPWSSVDQQAQLISLLATHPSSAGLRMNYALLDSAPVGVLGPDPWVLSELLWNPSQSVESLKARYYKGAFGEEVGAIIEEYFSLIQAAMNDTLLKSGKYKARDIPLVIFNAYTPIREKCGELINKAELAASKMDFRFQWRVARIATGWKYADLTLQLMQLQNSFKKKEFNRLKEERNKLLRSPESEMSLSRVSLSHQETIVPIFKR